MEEVGPIFLILNAMGELIFDLDLEEDDERNQVPKNNFYLERVVPRFNDRQFQAHFRIMPDSFEYLFEYLLGKIHSVIPEIDNQPGRPQILLEKQLLLTIWYLGNLECIRSVADRFGVAKSTMWQCMRRILIYVIETNLRYKFVAWPNEEMAAATAEALENINGFAGVIGIIDGCHIEILAPKENANSYFNRKKFHSLLLQGVCNEKKMFIDVFTGVPGSCHDMRLLQPSDLSQRLENENSFPNDTHLIGDLAYMLQRHLLVGFKDHGNLTERQKNYNKKLNQLRVLIENTFALLKGRWRRLKYLETTKLELVTLFIIVACIFHNICMMHDDVPGDINLEEEAEEIVRVHEIIPFNGDLRQDGARKRRIIMNNLPMNP